MTVDEYLSQLLNKLQRILGNNLVGLYQIGSVALKAFRENQSDLDILGVLSKPLSTQQKDTLAKNLDHLNFNCPAMGLDLVLLTNEAITSITNEPAYEFWFSTGASWKQDNWASGRSKEMLIFIELCRSHGITLFGIKPSKYFTAVDKPLMISAFLEILQWHKTKILDDFHDPQGQNSVLNACRIFAFVHEGFFYSKSAGGRWMLAKEPNNVTVMKALRIQSGKKDVKISKQEISKLLKKVITVIEANQLKCNNS